jgi:hypothetical protein
MTGHDRKGTDRLRQLSAPIGQNSGMTDPPSPYGPYGHGPNSGFYHGPHHSGISGLLSQFGGQLFVIVLIVMLSVGVAFAVRRRPSWPFGLEPIATCLAVGSGLAVLVATLTRRDNASSSGHIQLVPLLTLRHYRYNLPDLLVYMGGNIALFLPLGFFLCLALRRRMLASVAISTTLCTLTSIGVEILQVPIWSRTSDVDDVLTNAFGGLIGAIIGTAVLRLITRRPTGPTHTSTRPTHTSTPFEGAPSVLQVGTSRADKSARWRYIRGA